MGHVLPSDLFSLKSHLLGTLGRDLFHLLEEHAHKKYQTIESSSASSAGETIAQFSANHYFPKHITEYISDCRDSLQSDISAFLCATDALAAALELPIQRTDRHLDKHRLLMLSHTKGASKQAETAPNRITQFRITCTLLVAKKTSILLYTTTRHLAILIKIIQRECNSETSELVNRCYQAMIEHVKSKRNAPDRTDNLSDHQWISNLEALKRLVLDTENQ